jgi:2-polyprenyl-3-methyl-5-hydroxy-6-metoxy-1,4-benzoquinol methylase
MHVTRSREDRWQQEVQFFDAWASSQQPRAVDPLTIARYAAARPRRHFNKEYRFRVLGDLTGKQILDVGCGDGINSVLLARLGARVVGVDISPKAIEVAVERARINGVSDRVSFLCSPVETAALSEDAFDIVWGDAVLHHVLDPLDEVLARLARACRRDGVMIFSEPVNFSPLLRRIRLLLPIPVEGTPNERPLEPSDVDVLRRYIHPLEVRHFALLGRLERFVLESMNYEKSSRPRRLVADAMGALDYALLSAPALQPFSSTAVFSGVPRK